MDFVITVTRVTGNARAVPAFAPITATENNWDTPTAATGGYTSTQTSTHNTTDLTTITDKYMGQIGVIANLSTGSTPGTVSGYIDVTLSACMVLIGQRLIEVSGQSDNITPNYYLLGRAPANSASGVRAAVIAEGCKDVEYRMMVRGLNDTNSPSAWTALGAGYTALADGNSATCFPNTSVSGVTPANYHQLEFGIAVRMKSGGSSPAGQVRVAAALSYS